MKVKFYSVFYSVVLIILFLGCESSTDPDPVGGLEITVTTNDLFPINNAKVFIKESEFKDTTNKYGKALIKNIPGGFYEVVAYYERYGSGMESINIKPGELNEVSIKLISGILIEPIVSIQSHSPYDRNKYSVGDSVIIEMQIFDNETSPENITVELVSDLDGTLIKTKPQQNGILTYITNQLSKGTHIIDIIATDMDGHQGKNSLKIMNVRPPRVKLFEPLKTNDGIKLSWSTCDDPDFDKYEIYRYTKNGYNGDEVKLKEIFSKQATGYTDSLPPFKEYVFYLIVAYDKKGEESVSNTIKVNEPNGKVFNYQIKDALIHPQLPYLYFLTIDNKLVMYNYDLDEVVLEKELSSVVNYMELGDNGSGIELYIPDRDGYINIYNPVSLDKIFSINCKLPVMSVVIDGKGHIFAGVGPSSQQEKPVSSYSRDTGEYIDGSGQNKMGRLRMLPNKNEMMAISTSGSSDMEYYKLTAEGKFEMYKEEQNYGHHPLNPYIFRIAPSGDYLLTSSSGTLFKADESMEALGSLPGGDLSFSDFAFDNISETIYAGCSNARLIQLYNYKTLETGSQIKSKAYPYFLFKKDNELIVICKTKITSWYDYNYKIGFEVIEIND